MILHTVQENECFAPQSPSTPRPLHPHFFAGVDAGAFAGGALVASVGGAADFLPWRLMRSKRWSSVCLPCDDELATKSKPFSFQHSSARRAPFHKENLPYQLQFQHPTPAQIWLGKRPIFLLHPPLHSVASANWDSTVASFVCLLRSCIQAAGSSFVP